MSMNRQDTHLIHRSRGELISLDGARSAKNSSAEIAWQRFVDAKLLSERTLKLEDGIAAGKAYREFCELFARAS